MPKFKIQIAPQDLFSIFLLLACYPLAQFLPPKCGWENGLIENAQAILLLIGAMFCGRASLFGYVYERTELGQGVFPYRNLY